MKQPERSDRVKGGGKRFRHPNSLKGKGHDGKRGIDMFQDDADQGRREGIFFLYLDGKGEERG